MEKGVTRWVFIAQIDPIGASTPGERAAHAARGPYTRLCLVLPLQLQSCEASTKKGVTRWVSTAQIDPIGVSTPGDRGVHAALHLLARL